MSRRIKSFLIVLSVLVFPLAAAADDLTGQQEFLCTSVQVNVCTDDGKCASSNPWDLNIPQFIEVNLKDKKLSTTRASGENRSTPIRNQLNEGGFLYLQGVEGGRAFSFVIEESSGFASIAVVTDGKTVTVFGACTPMAAPTK
jgi:hypothetical protein